MMKKKLKSRKALWIPIIVLILFLVPYLVEKLVSAISGSTFTLKFVLPKEVWFGFIGSYLGAVGTVILGAVAIWQNKRYKELSDDSSKEVMEIQGELKNLNKRIVDAIETLENIEVAVYTPAIQEILHYYHNVRKETLDDNSDSCAYQINRINIFEDNPLMPLEELMEKYSTFAFTIRNIGEKPIRNFTCRKITLNGTSPNYILYLCLAS
ncbi:hypothetical protein [Proteiniclasticum ruminis]|nr:hypothetical protein [Proteiniclasticum ruminis]